MKQGLKTSAEQVVLDLRQIEACTAQGQNLALAYKDAELSEQYYYRRCEKYGSLYQTDGDHHCLAFASPKAVHLRNWSRR